MVRAVTLLALALLALALVAGQDDIREEQEGYYDTQEWKAVGPFTPSLPGEPSGGGEGPRLPPEGEEGGQPPRRRRGRRRKGGGRRGGRRRKQRPHLPALDTDELAEGAEREAFQGRGPPLSHDVNSGLLEPYTGPPDELGVRDEAPRKNKSYRRAYSQAKRQENQDQDAEGGSADLKALLKRSGGLSLSEVLQQSNLSLADLLTGKKRALSALKTSDINYEEQSDRELNESNMRSQKEEIVENNEEKPRRRLPPSNKATKNSPRERMVNSSGPEAPKQNRNQAEREEFPRRRLPAITAARKTKQKIEEQTEDTTTERHNVAQNHSRKTLNENIIRRRVEEAEVSISETTEVPTDFKNLIENDDEIIITTTEAISTTTVKKEQKVEEIQSRLSLKPRLRLPSIKQVPRRISNPEIRSKPVITKNNSDPLQNIKSRKPIIPAQAIPISIKDLFGMSDIISAAKIITKANTDATTTTYASPTSKSISPSTTELAAERGTMATITSSASPGSPSTPAGSTSATPTSGPSAKEEILEVLTDIKGGERLTRVLAERNMSLGELVAQRERGSSQLHLADIFPNSSRSPSAPEPFLSKSMIEPISRQIYPLQALLEGNMGKAPSPPQQGDIHPPPMFVDLSKNSQSEGSLGIVTLFDKFSEFGGLPKVLDAKDIKKDSDGSSYFTSVISVQPTDEVFRESRSGLGFQNSHKQVSQIFSSIPTYINTEEIIDARVIPDWDVPHHEQSMYLPDKQQLPDAAEVRDVDGDGLIVLGDLGDLVKEDGEGESPSPQHTAEQDREEGLYSRLPIAVRSAIMVSSVIAGTSLLVFLTIFVACRLRQRRRTMHYSEGRKGSNPALTGSRSISPILLGAGPSEPQYLWDSLRKPFQ